MADIASCAETGSAAEPAPDATAPVAADPAAPPPAPAPKPALLPVVAVCLAAFASVVSAVGMIVATRNVAEANHAIAALTAKPAVHAPAAAPASAPKPVAPTVLPDDAVPATMADVRTALAGLRQDVARHQGPGNSMVISAMHDGQTELANRLGELTVKIDRIDRALSASRPAKP